jgi:hypothetical protein
MTNTSVCVSCARTLNRMAVQYRQWAKECDAAGKISAARHWAKESRTRFEDARWWLERGRRLSDG